MTSNNDDSPRNASEVIGKTGGKEEVFFKICNSVLKKEVEKGHLKWTVSDVARDADVTRSLVYYYFGKEREKIFEEAWRYMVEIFFTLTPEAARRPIHERMRNILLGLKQMPYLFVIFFLEKWKNSEIGQKIKDAEVKLLKDLAQEFSELPKQEIFKIYLLELGAIAYSLDPDQTPEVFNFPQKLDK